MTAFSEIADGVYVLAHPQFNINVTLITGTEAALLVDTLSTPEQAADLLAEVRDITSAPLSVVNTHFHFDHTFGNATMPATAIWGHPSCATELTDRGEHWRLKWEAEYGIDLGGVVIRPPDRLVRTAQVLDLGGRDVTLSYHGRGHTAGDLVVRTGNVLITGDLTEQDAPPSFEDAYPLDWPDTLAALLSFCTNETVVVPGHGSVSDREFVKRQHDDLTRLDWLIREGHADGAPVARIAAAAPFASEIAVRRGFAQLDGSLAV
ncbi:MBL fold metallo-hydrolase [Catelliglobosispora koreensis]|uniref:MBL fold metallo-hydrolase n=1 Tax=Catelliglobosispora koreensis TaxID=129052 RepID=UPI0003695B93|nr:MBL fold metallo-hydrolase [Catelliglobosispora koreensis]